MTTQIARAVKGVRSRNSPILRMSCPRRLEHEVLRIIGLEIEKLTATGREAKETGMSLAMRDC